MLIIIFNDFMIIFPILLFFIDLKIKNEIKIVYYYL